VKVVFGALWALLFLAGCGAAGAPIAVSPAPSAAGSLSDSDSGRTLTYHVGDTISITLHQQQGFQPWTTLDSSNHAVLSPMVNTRNTAVRGVTLGLFKAAASGSAQITANAGVDCSPGMACPAMVRVWSVTIQVV
jgi:hypothetical protein